MVATVLTVYGIETFSDFDTKAPYLELQQYLPFTVLKLKSSHNITSILSVATVLTVYGIETIEVIKSDFLYVFVATVLTVYGIETK